MKSKQKRKYDVSWSKALMIGTLLVGLSGCATYQDEAKWIYPPMARPLQADVQQEIQIARLSQLLTRDDLSDDIRAKIFFERGNYYDLLGLRNLARFDYEQSLQLNPAQADVYNMLGVYYTEIGEYEAAYDAFDSTLELNPKYDYAYRNQAIALYYGERPELATDEIQTFIEKEPTDPFGAIWQYLIDVKIDPVKAKAALNKRYEQRDDGIWGWLMASVLLETQSDKEVFHKVLNSTRDNTLLAERLTEIYFYMGKREQIKGDFAQAISLYKLAISLNVYEYVEHRYAFLELEKIYHDLKDEHMQQVEKVAAQ